MIESTVEKHTMEFQSLEVLHTWEEDFCKKTIKNLHRDKPFKKSGFSFTKKKGTDGGGQDIEGEAI